ncbi:hypothetical protein PV04_04141 [Phialophora macrospora]|uniref:Uncharacterized protein n=1 Tax=Phialophora macrospora TaxID=1851006 RepID=A0A0D2FNK4_9EURO|nr:hypothetical protein PV04_04141 [Phialophora macrospora]
MADTNMDDWVDVEREPQHGKQKPVASDVEDEKAEYSFYTMTAKSTLARLNKDVSPIFVVDTPQETLWSTWLDTIDPSLRQCYTCTTCRRFMKRYGGLVQVDSDGALKPLLWRPTKQPGPKNFCASIQAIHDKVSSGSVVAELKITPKTRSVGARTSGGYNHFYLDFPEARIRKQEPKGFESASVSVLATMLGRVVDDYSVETVRQAFTILTQDKLPHADNHKAAIRWFRRVREIKGIEKDSEKRTRHNLLYLHAATSFKGCLNQLRTGALSTLLQDIEAGKDFDEIKKLWVEVNDPMRYLRPQAAPTAGHIAVAERLMESLGVTANDMRRRQFTMSELPEKVIMFTPPKKRLPLHPKPDGIFSKLKTRNPTPKPAPANKKSLETPPTRISFSKFMTDIVPTAVKIEYKLEDRNSIYFVLTGDEGTKPLMQWHGDENRASWFVYLSPRPVERHNLVPQDWNEVSCVIPFPHLWDGVPLTTTFPLAAADSTDFKYYHKNHGFRYLFCLEGIKLGDNDMTSSCLFPSLLKSEFHGIRRAIEAYSNTHRLEPVPDIEDRGGIVAGVLFERAQDMGEDKHLLRVTDEKGDMNMYAIVLFE